MKNELIQPAATIAATLLAGKTPGAQDICDTFLMAYQALEAAQRKLAQEAGNRAAAAMGKVI